MKDHLGFERPQYRLKPGEVTNVALVRLNLVAELEETPVRWIGGRWQSDATHLCPSLEHEQRKPRALEACVSGDEDSSTREAPEIV
jgi:hypothetical protein